MASVLSPIHVNPVPALFFVFPRMNFLASGYWRFQMATIENCLYRRARKD